MTPADRLLHPVALGAAALMAFNDHFMKVHQPGLLSGKLSDVAGLVLLPLVLLGLAELAARRPLGGRALVACMAVSALGYTLVEVWPPAASAWCWTWGLLQWPVRALVAGELVPVAPVRAWSDPTDLLVLPATFGAWLARGALTRRSTR